MPCYSGFLAGDHQHGGRHQSGGRQSGVGENQQSTGRFRELFKKSDHFKGYTNRRPATFPGDELLSCSIDIPALQQSY